MSDRTDIFAGHCSRCAPQQKLIVSVEKNSKHTACNNAMCMVRHYQIDGDVIVDKNMDKCDYIVVNDDCQTAYFIELKGSKMIHAIKQINSTVRVLKPYLSGYRYFYRIVFSGSATHGINGSEALKWQDQGKANGIPVAKVARSQYREDI